MTRTVLITSTRAPAALDLARLFAAGGWRVIGADCAYWPLGRFSNVFARHHRIPPPRTNHNAFAEAIAQLIMHEHIDLLLPTCEEVFYVARHFARLSRFCHVACAPLDIMRALHDKSQLPRTAGGLGVNVPETLLLENSDDIVKRCRMLSDKVVLKPVFSRFSSRTLICPDDIAIAELRPSPAESWVCQRFIEGEEYCTYAVADAGILTAFAAYRPLHRVGKGSGILFEPMILPEIERFAAGFAARHGFSGQFAFDFIRTADGGWYVLECNPRATSGVHLFKSENTLPAAFLDRPKDIIRPRAFLI